MTMRVERVGASRGAAATRRTAKSGGGSFAAAIDRAAAPAAAEAAAPVSAAGPVHALDALVAMQAADGDRPGRRRAVSRGESILDSLDELRMALLTGRLTVAQLERLAATVASHRAHSSDPRLAAVLDEIDLRAQVELAKYEAGR